MQDPKFDAKSRYCLEMLDAALKAGNPKDIKLPKAPEGLTPADMENAFFTAARVFMHLRNYPMAQYFGTVRQKDAPVYVCQIVETAPREVAVWESISRNFPVANEFERYNEQAAALLINDVNSVRETATVKTDKDCPVSFQAVADKFGISIYVKSTTDRQEQIAAGLADGGTYEMYLQPGHGEYYYQWLYNVNVNRTGPVDSIPWMTPGKNFRFLHEYMLHNSQVTKDGVGTVFFIPWTVMYDKLPNAQSEWKLGVIPWVAEGGFTWGSGQVHELNKFGTLKFDGIEKIMPEIKQLLIQQAWSKYNRSKGGICSFWNDEMRGDRKFEAEVLNPFVEKYNEMGKLVSDKMDAATIDKLFNEAVPVWNELTYYVDELRTRYLQNQLLSK